MKLLYVYQTLSNDPDYLWTTCTNSLDQVWAPTKEQAITLWKSKNKGKRVKIVSG